MKPRKQVYETYWYFAAERQQIFFKRLRAAEPPYTEDPILQSYKFCNTFRANDRVSQFLIKNVTYAHKCAPEDTLFRILLFRLLNKIETWQHLEQKVGSITLENFSTGHYAAVLEELKAEGPIYGNAFILCANKAFGFDEKHKNHLALLEWIFQRSSAGLTILSSKSLEQLFWNLRELPLLGDFMAYQIAIDMNYSDVFAFNENEFTIAGPGAKRGIAKCFEDVGNTGPSEVIQWMVENQAQEFARLGLSFETLGGRLLHAIDCQGLFCETDKYCRVRFPELASNRVRIKSAFTPTAQLIHYFYPPKWNISL